MKTKLSISFFATIFYVLFSSTLLGLKIEVNIQDTSDLDPSAIWHSAVWKDGSILPGCEQEISSISVQREEEIGGRMSQIIGVTEGGIYYPESELPLYRENKKLYFYEDSTWKLLYDFSAIGGDTVHYFLSKKVNFYLRPYGVIQEIDFMIPATSLSLVVNKVDTIITNSGLPIKRFKCTDLTGFRIGHAMNIIYENIGSKDGLFGEIGSWIGPECFQFPIGLQCYSESGQNFSFVNHDCATLVATDDFDSKENLQIRPNPTNGSLTIVGLQRDTEIKIFDLCGNLCKTIKTLNSSISISDLPNGLYFGRLDFGNIKKTFKIIKIE
jgi:hypothetical protein